MADNHGKEIASGERFEFGANWRRFLVTLNEAQIVQAENSLCEFLGAANLAGKRFLDAGSGSGLFSLAARRLGATVHSFDYDPQSVACTRGLKNKYFANDENWIIDEASVLDQDYLSRLGKFDIVYSWGVLHHTGSMWKALGNVDSPVADDGQLFVAIYNDQGWISRYWNFIKRCYANNAIFRTLVIMAHVPYLGSRVAVRAITGRLDQERGMSMWYDLIDWLGGYPFEVARPDDIFKFYHAKGFNLAKLKTCGGRHGCNEFVFHKVSA